MPDTAQNRIRPQTAKLVCRLVAPLLDTGVVTSDELSIIRRNLNSLAKDGELAPPAIPKFVTGPEVAEMLGVCYSQFRQLEKNGEFPFSRHKVGGKVKFLLEDIVHYMLFDSIEEGGDAEE